MSHVFISYSKKNHDYARKLADKLLELGFDVWIDDKIDPGEQWWKAIVQAIRDCGAFIVIMTPESDTSEWVEREVMLAIHLPKQIYPVLLSGDLINSVNWTLFIGKQYVDARSGELPPDGFYARLGNHVERKTVRGAEFGEERLELPLPPDMSNVLPSFAWCYVAAGKVTLEAAREHYLNLHGRVEELSAFYISKYPITNLQYRIFAEASDGYRIKNWWTFSEDAELWWFNHESPQISEANELKDQPSVNITWFEATAFCNWLSHIVKESLTLPLEEEWQLAMENPSLIVTGNMVEWCFNVYPIDTTGIGGDMYSLYAIRGTLWSATKAPPSPSRRSFVTEPTPRNIPIGFRIAFAK